jgi:hypothetical protein
MSFTCRKKPVAHLAFVAHPWANPSPLTCAVVAILMFLAETMMDSDIAGGEVRPLQELGMNKVWIPIVIFRLAPIACCGIWLALRRRFPWLSLIIFLSLWVVIIAGTIAWDHAQILQVPIIHPLASDEFREVSESFPYSFVQQSDTANNYYLIIVREPDRSALLVSILRRIGETRKRKPENGTEPENGTGPINAR